MFLTVEGIKGSNKGKIARKLATGLDAFGYTPCFIEDNDFESQGEALDFIINSSDKVHSLQEKEVGICTFYLDSFAAAASEGSLYDRSGLISGVMAVYNLCIPDLSVHLVCDPRVATNRLLALSSEEMCVEKNLETCRNWEEVAEEFMSNLSAIRALDRTAGIGSIWREELDMSLDYDFIDQQVDVFFNSLLERERIKNVRKSRSKTRKELRSN